MSFSASPTSMAWVLDKTKSINSPIQSILKESLLLKLKARLKEKPKELKLNKPQLKIYQKKD
jgi:hypothetical protein